MSSIGHILEVDVMLIDWVFVTLMAILISHAHFAGVYRRMKTFRPLGKNKEMDFGLNF